ncbi:outer membrane protein assembly factor BamB family protein [Nucisporomicrobium flavum]|uniref:outer membrane protein assembly factor BamB family protein n=1 Tax=Nucisporomicrobium flavum TaxID=2785915 RepID=UPI0018F3B09C|nr:PQQ-binding-like beta-propeller repeat protein [Nucisporomicrobium flavum]
MPADLDQMFAALGRDADAVPLAAPDAARRRGVQRSRTRVLGAAVALVAVMGASAGISAVRDAPTPPAVSHGGPLAEVGSPIAYESEARITLSAADADRAYAAWEDHTGGIHVVAAELHTGATAWPERSLGRFAGLGALVAVPQALVVTVEHGGDLTGKRSAYVLDPASGRERWHVASTAADEFLYTGAGLVTVSGQTGLTQAFDWVTGARLWTAAPATDRIVRTAAMPTPDDFLVQVTEARQLLVRDLRTGRVLRELEGAPSPEAYLVASGGTLYSAENDEGASYVIRATDVTRESPSRTIFTGPEQRRVTSMAMCGPARLCLLDDSDAGGEPFLPDGTNTALTALSVPDGRKAWRMAAPHHAQTIEARDGRILVGGGEGGYALHDAQGTRVWRDLAPAGWLTDDKLITLPVDGVLSAVSATDGRARVMGGVPVDPATCARTADRLACATPTSLRLWELPG